MILSENSIEVSYKTFKKLIYRLTSYDTLEIIYRNKGAIFNLLVNDVKGYYSKDSDYECITFKSKLKHEIQLGNDYKYIVDMCIVDPKSQEIKCLVIKCQDPNNKYYDVDITYGNMFDVMDYDVDINIDLTE